MFARARYKYPVEEPKSCPVDLSDVPTNVPAILNTTGSASRFKGVYKKENKWQAQIRIASKAAGMIYLGTFDSEEAAGIMFSRARYKYPAHRSALIPSERSTVQHRSIVPSTPAARQLWQ